MLTRPTSPLTNTPSAGPSALRDNDLESRFWRHVADLEETHRRLWWRTRDREPRLGEPVDRHRQADNAQRTKAFIDAIADIVRDVPERRSTGTP